MSLHSNLGTALSSQGMNKDASVHYKKAITTYLAQIEDIVDNDMLSSAKDIASQSAFYLGMVYQDSQQPQLAIQGYKFAIDLNPNHWSAFANMASVLFDQLKLPEDALWAYNQVYALLTDMDNDDIERPAHPEPILSQIQYRIGLCLTADDERKCAMEDAPDQEIDCQQMAAHAFSLALQYDENNEAAKHMLASVTADATVERASNSYIKSLFDEYASNFEHSLVDELGYSGYERLRRGFDRALKSTGADEQKYRLVVDAGCGTGLVGEQFRNISDTLIGVDLSAVILQEAETARPGLYDETIAGDVIEAFEAKKPISLIVAADSYIYFGDLTPLFDAMSQSLEIGGYSAFTLENVGIEVEQALAESKPDWRWQLTASGRFAHRAEYVKDAGTAHGFDIVHYEPMDGFRFEKGIEVRGHLFVMKKLAVEGTSPDGKDEL
eukprot:CAMPEP_0198133792 /NCGR_PEP_ID=MMETSP1442-20131203/59749_1 /TAXON_ID= /ORGANISM="Craspedostauros australis, Strain CCMP3328" /LENGTH=438 /DNA_ID=CAMNT_0043794925 /DNA_START=22 /DNA_END=1338 /DNA_ORIENTATION=+